MNIVILLYMTLEESLKDQLNPQQYRAVVTLEGPILIIAGAGSGKTRVITYRIANMLEHGIPQSQILALTFTNKAAKEMQERIKGLTNKKLQNLTVSTFHAFGVKILRQEIESIGFRPNFSIYDETDRNALIKETGRELHYSSDSMDIYKIGGIISDIKTGRKTWDNETKIYQDLYNGYQEGLKLYNAVDFDDLIVLPIKIFREHPEILARYKDRFRYLMIDEFQDTSHQQYEFMHLLAENNVAVVGDDDQSIYSWRGADYENIINFEKDFPGMQEIRLEQNYRSTGTILAAANGVIKNNTNRKDKELWTGSGDGKPIEVYLPENEAAEASFIAEAIQGICFDEKRKYDDFGVLMRSNSQSRALEEAFLESNIPYTMSGGTSFYERKEIKDIISYLRVIANHDDDINLLRIINTPRRGIGRTAIESLNKAASYFHTSLFGAIEIIVTGHGIYYEDSEGELTEISENENSLFAGTGEIEKSTEASGKIARTFVTEKVRQDLEDFYKLIDEHKVMLGGKGLSKKIRAMVEEINYWDYLLMENPKSDKAARYKYMNIESLIKSIEIWENNPENTDTSLYAYLNRITLLSRDDLDDSEDKGKVNMMTIHASKGLEFPIVFIAGAEEDLMPHARAVEDGGDAAVEEERRLFYVAVTRAQDRLFISSCRQRHRMNSTNECKPSRFLDEIPSNLVKYHEPDEELTNEKAQELLQNMIKNFSKPKIPKL